jgi:hypothetical protein
MTAGPLPSLRDDLGTMAVNLAQWSCRDTARDKAAARRGLIIRAASCHHPGHAGQTDWWLRPALA